MRFDNAFAIHIAYTTYRIRKVAVMANEPFPDPKSRKVGTISLLTAKKMKGWDDYVAKSLAFTKAKHEMEDAKDAVKEALKVALKGKSLPSGVRVQDDTNIDFIVAGHEVRVIEHMQKKGGRTRTNDDLSAFF